MKKTGNQYIPAEDRDFFILLRIGLWQKVEEELSADPDWEYIYRLSCEQTVQGIIADALGLYQEAYPECHVPAAVYNNFLQQAANVIQRNLQINQLQAKICKLFSEEGITYVVMKGQAAAQCYPKPLLRVSGDIDYYLDDENYTRAKELLKQLAAAEGKEPPTHKHASFRFGDSDVELHADELSNIRKHKIFKQLKDEMLHKGDFRSYDCDGVEVNLAPASFDVTYIFLHFVKHFYAGGIGLRQIVDWIMALEQQSGEAQTSQIDSLIVKYDLKTQWEGFVQFAIAYLGLPVSNVFGGKDSSKQELVTLWEEMKKYGIIKLREAQSGHPVKQTVLEKFVKISKRFVKQCELSPFLAICNYWKSIINAIRIKFVAEKHS